MATNRRILQVVAANVKKYREENEFSVVQAAKRLGVGRQYWYVIEDGRGNLPLARLESIAKILGVTVADLLADGNGNGNGSKRKKPVGGRK